MPPPFPVTSVSRPGVPPRSRGRGRGVGSDSHGSARTAQTGGRVESEGHRGEKKDRVTPGGAQTGSVGTDETRTLECWVACRTTWGVLHSTLLPSTPPPGPPPPEDTKTCLWAQSLRPVVGRNTGVTPVRTQPRETHPQPPLSKGTSEGQTTEHLKRVEGRRRSNSETSGPESKEPPQL